MEADIGWEDYEDLVKDIYLALGQAHGVEVECWGKSCRVEGPPGSFHQIDVLTCHSDGMHQYRTAISCKYWNQKVGIADVRELAAIVADAKLSKGIVVSRMGFTEPASTYAKSQNIGLVVLRRPLDKDWEGLVRRVHINLVVTMPELYDVKMRVAPKAGQEAGVIDNIPLDFREAVVGQETLDALIQRELRERPSEETYKLEFPPNSVLSIPTDPEHPAHGCSIRQLQFKVTHSQESREIVVTGDDYVFMFMESIFEERRYIFDNEGRFSSSDYKEDAEL